MPLTRQILRRSPLDINKNIRIGVAFPLNEENLFKGTSTLKEQAKSNLLNLILTYPGERINLPNFGVGLKRLLFEQNINSEVLQSTIENQVKFYIPNIIVNRLEVTPSEDNTTFYIRINYISTLDGSTDSIQLNFN